MAHDSTISGLPAGTSPNGTELIPVVQSGQTVRLTVAQVASYYLNIADYTALRAYTGLQFSVYVTGYLVSKAPSGIAGVFVRDDSDTTSADNGGTIIVDSSGRRWKRQYDGDVDARWFGAVQGEDAASAINDAITAVSAGNGGRVTLPAGVWEVSQVVVKSYVTFAGVRDEGGWARLGSYTKGTVIKAMDGSGVSPVAIESPSTNWGVVDLVVDANKANQTVPGVHCIEHKRTSATSSPGGVIKGVKCVNPNGFGLYLVGINPAEISESVFMSGMYLSLCYDIQVRGCSIDGTDSIHPALWMTNGSHKAFGDNLIFRGESANQQISQTYTVDTVADTITVTDDSVFYDWMPVALTTAGTFPDLRDQTAAILRGNDTFLVKKLGSNVLELYVGNIASYLAGATKVAFNTAGVGTQTITSGITDIVHIVRESNDRIADCRIAGSPGGATTITLSSKIQYDDNNHWGLNYDNGANTPAVRITGCQNCTLSNSQLGDGQQGAGITLVKEAVYIEDDSSNPAGTTSVSSQNILANNQYRLTQAAFVTDVSTATYEQRNLITGLDGVLCLTGSRIASPKYRRQPGLYYYKATTSTTTVPTSSNTVFAWTAVSEGNPAGLTNGTSISVPDTAHSLVRVSGKVGFSNRQPGAYYIVVFVAVGGVSHRFEWEQQADTSMPSYIVVPFDVEQVCTADTTVSVTVFQTSGVDLTVATGSDYSQLTIQKLADYIKP